MFINLKNKIHTVQQGITSSFWNLSSHGTVQVQEDSHDCIKNKGADVLNYYQVHWTQLHKLAEENAMKAQEVDERIEIILTKVESEWNKITVLYSLLSRVPQISQDVDKLLSDIDSLQNSIDKVESMLINLEDTIEMQTLQESQLEKRFQLAMHREKRLAKLESITTNLSADHLLKLNKHENRVKVIQKERQTTFDNAFQNDLENYKKYGAIPQKDKQSNLDQNMSLDDVQLDYDPEELNEFVNG